VKVAILCGGRGTRLGSITERIPKSLVEVAGEPFIFHQLRLLRDQGFKDVVLCIGHLGDMIRATVAKGKGLGMRVEYSEDGPLPLKTGGAVKKAIPLLGDNFMVIYGDSYLPIDYEPIIDAFIESKKHGLMTHHKGVDYGIGVFTKKAFRDFLILETFDLGLVYECVCASKNLARYEVNEPFYEIGSLSGLKEVRDKLSIATNSNM
jgi:NDP-sugar pyrophosphorylase family protein